MVRFERHAESLTCDDCLESFHLLDDDEDDEDDES